MELKTEDGTPRMKVWILNDNQVVGLCPFCGLPHLHGRAGGNGEGLRAPHCLDAGLRPDYYLVPQAGEIPREILLAMRRRPRQTPGAFASRGYRARR